MAVRRILGVDVAVSTPRMLSALVEEAVTVGDLVRLFTFRQAGADLVEITLAHDSPVVGGPRGRRQLAQRHRPGGHPAGGPRVIPPTEDDPLEAGDELIFVAAPDQESSLEDLLSGEE